MKRPERPDEERLEHFIEVVEGCLARRAIEQQTLASSFTLSASEHRPLHVTADSGDEEDFRSLMLEFRKLIANESDAQFFKIHNIVWKELGQKHPLAIASGENRVHWQRAHVGDIAFDVHGEKLQGISLVEGWFNGVLFHADKEKATFFEGFHADKEKATFFEGLDPVLMGPLVMTQLVSVVVDCLDVACQQKEVVQDVLQLIRAR